MLARQGVIDIVIPLEDRELLMRFGKEYEEYLQEGPITVFSAAITR
ncbi:MAG: hypothetical protein AABZ10_16390 [Nitrospirota bacterium]